MDVYGGLYKCLKMSVDAYGFVWDVYGCFLVNEGKPWHFMKFHPLVLSTRDLHLMSLTLPVSLNMVWKSTIHILSFLMTKPPFRWMICHCPLLKSGVFLGHSPFMDYDNPNESWLIPEPILNPGLWIQIEFGLNSASYAHHVPRYVYIILILYIYVCVCSIELSMKLTRPS